MIIQKKNPLIFLYPNNYIKKPKHFFLKNVLITKNKSLILSPFLFWILKIKLSIQDIPQLYSLKGLTKISSWFSNFKKNFNNIFITPEKKNLLYKENAKLLHVKFRRNLNKFLEFKKKKAEEQKILDQKIKKMPLNLLLLRFKSTYNFINSSLFRKIRPLPFIKSNSIFFKAIKKINKKRQKLKLFLLSKRILNSFKEFLYKNSLNFINFKILQLFNPYKNFILKKIKKSILVKNRFTTFSNNISDKLNLIKNKIILVKNQFPRFMNFNEIFDKLNLTQNLNIFQYFKNNSDFLRAEHFRNLINKETAFFNYFYKNQNYIKLLTTITGHNIYLTLFFSNPYKILWKVSAGMLGFYRFRKAKRFQSTFKELLLHCQLFLAKHYKKYKAPLQVIIRHFKYIGNRALFQSFIKKNNINPNVERLNQIKLFNFYNKNSTLLTNHIFQFLNNFWLKEKKQQSITALTAKNLIQTRLNNAYN